MLPGSRKTYPIVSAGPAAHRPDEACATELVDDFVSWLREIPWAPSISSIVAMPPSQYVITGSEQSV